MGGVIGKGECHRETKLEAKIMEAMQRREAVGCTIKSFNSIILKFPKIDESFRKCKATFQDFGKYPLCVKWIGM